MTSATAIVEEREADWDVRQDYEIVGRNKDFRGTVVEARDMRMSGLPVLLRSVFLTKKHNTDLIGAFALLREASLSSPFIANVYRLILHKRREGPQLIVASQPPVYGNLARLLNAWMTGSTNAPPPLHDNQVLTVGLNILDALERLESIGFSYRYIHPTAIGINNSDQWRMLLPSLNEFPVPGTEATEREQAFIPADMRGRDEDSFSMDERARMDLHSLGLLMYQLRVWDLWSTAAESRGLPNEALQELNRFHAGDQLRDVLIKLVGHGEKPSELCSFEEARAILDTALQSNQGSTQSSALPNTPSRFSGYLNIGKESRMTLEDRELWDRAAENTQDAVVREIASELGEEFGWLRTERFESQGWSTRIGIFEHKPTKIEMCLIPGGMFKRGLADPDRERAWLKKHKFERISETVREETPVSELLIQPFLISRFPVMIPEWERMTKAGKSKSTERLPITEVSYDEIVSRLEATPGYLRLPSENEWEYACRAGAQTRFFWGEEMDDRYCWHVKNSGGVVKSVDEHKDFPNSFGLVDMLGNILEWCQDHFVDRYEDASTDNRPRILKKPDSDQRRVVRGGCAWYAPAFCRASARFGVRAPAQKRKSDPKPPSFGALGFRVVRTLNG